MNRVLSNVSVILASFGSVLAGTLLDPISASVVIQVNSVNQVNYSTQTNCRKGNRVLKTQSRRVGTFTSIDVSGSYDVEVVAQQSPSLVISGEDNILPKIITEVKGNTLFIYTKGCIITQKRLKVKITSREIQKVSAAGANKIKVSSLKNQTFNIAQKGGTKSELFGTTKQLYATVTGASDVNAQKLYSQKAKVEISGAGNVNVFATEALNVGIIGVGVVNYYGNPKTVTRNVVGVGSINKKGS